jgi:hypothetical protein
MTTYPGTGQAMTAGVLADGTTINHLTQHGNVIDIPINAKKYLRGDGTTESASQITALQTAAAGAGGVGRRVYFPAGIYAWPDGVSFDVSSTHMQVTGAGRNNTFITVKDAYAFTATAPNDCLIRDIHVSQRAGATTGGGIKFDSAAACSIKSMYIEMVSTCTDPGIWLKGTVGSHVEHCVVGGNTGTGIRLDAAGATLGFCNANTVYKSRVVSTLGATTAAVYGGGGGNRYRDCIIESNRGYGLYLDGTSADTVEGCWFEDNSNHNIYLVLCGQTQVVGNKIHYNHGDIGTAEHIKMTGAVNGRQMIRIEGNRFQDPSSSGTAIDIGANTEFTTVIANAGAGISNSTTISDAGSYTGIMFNDSATSAGDIMQFPGGSSFRKMPRIKTNRTAAASGGDPNSVEAVFSASSSVGTNLFMIGSRGIPIFATGDTSAITGTDELPGDAFAFYWDNTNGLIKARTRDHSGTYATKIVGGPQSAAYTVANPTTDRALNVTGDTLPQVAQVLGTLIADLQTAGLLT